MFSFDKRHTSNSPLQAVSLIQVLGSRLSYSYRKVSETNCGQRFGTFNAKPVGNCGQIRKSSAVGSVAVHSAKTQ